ncbi:prepilin-type N-terminal cleavage/methylation domain-containing protein [Metabacillus fastidiosus]|uniref:prepilin-type N-terminal cleavage/methylation domain-containing protein n=1 Tax=Metabacillus fastidiosus TaxID=1458 RepID=UPI0008243E34|nr:prepilin-type N-terminal cleavage/methylation domain-containing protein [Metabacillus fastidiosus]MED4464027.1 prepilin-type N-terminal cleavage/methylation domain-containing protein [Metabacillus fastidiosus]
MKRKILNNSGITLLELVVSIAILSIILITFAGLFMNAFKYNAMSGDKLQSVNIAQEYAERIKKDTDFYDCMSILQVNPANCAKLFESSKTFSLKQDVVSDPDDSEYYFMQLVENDTDDIISIKISKTKESEVISKSLYRLIIEAKKNEADKMPSKTYLYYEYE